MSNYNQNVNYAELGNTDGNNLDGKKPLKNEFDFYDDYDIEDMDTGENYSYNDGPAKFGLIGGVLALLSCLVIVGLMGAIYHRDKNSLTLSHLIMACIGVLIAGLIAGVCAMTSGALKKRMEPNHLLIGIALIMALVFFCYFLASSAYMFMYRPYHHGALVRKFNSGDSWKKIFKNRSFNSGWGTDRRVLWWTVFFGLTAALGFLIGAICLWLSSW